MSESLIIQKTTLEWKRGQLVDNFVVDEPFDGWDVGWLSTDEDFGVTKEASAESAVALELILHVSLVLRFTLRYCWDGYLLPWNGKS